MVAYAVCRSFWASKRWHATGYHSRKEVRALGPVLELEPHIRSSHPPFRARGEREDSF